MGTLVFSATTSTIIQKHAQNITGNENVKAFAIHYWEKRQEIPIFSDF